MITAEQYAAAAELIGPNGEHWTKGTDARDAAGEPIGCLHHGARAWCVNGALCKAGGIREAPSLFLKVIGYEPHQNYAFWNDDSGRLPHEPYEALMQASRLAAEAR